MHKKRTTVKKKNKKEIESKITYLFTLAPHRNSRLCKIYLSRIGHLSLSRPLNCQSVITWRLVVIRWSWHNSAVDVEYFWLRRLLESLFLKWRWNRRIWVHLVLLWCRLVYGRLQVLGKVRILLSGDIDSCYRRVRRLRLFLLGICLRLSLLGGQIRGR